MRLTTRRVIREKSCKHTRWSFYSLSARRSAARRLPRVAIRERRSWNKRTRGCARKTTRRKPSWRPFASFRSGLHWETSSRAQNFGSAPTTVGGATARPDVRPKRRPYARNVRRSLPVKNDKDVLKKLQDGLRRVSKLVLVPRCLRIPRSVARSRTSPSLGSAGVRRNRLRRGCVHSVQ